MQGNPGPQLVELADHGGAESGRNRWLSDQVLTAIGRAAFTEPISPGLVLLEHLDAMPIEAVQ